MNLERCRTRIALAGQGTRTLGRIRAWSLSCTAPNEPGIDAKVHSSLLLGDAEICFQQSKAKFPQVLYNVGADSQVN